MHEQKNPQTKPDIAPPLTRPYYLKNYKTGPHTINPCKSIKTRPVSENTQMRSHPCVPYMTIPRLK